VPTNANNQDVVGMGSVVARQARRLLKGRRVVAIELVAAAGVDRVRTVLARARGPHATVRGLVPPRFAAPSAPTSSARPPHSTRSRLRAST
jgi:histidine ammonia-lyase